MQRHNSIEVVIWLNKLEGKSILVIMPFFFDYQKDILKCLSVYGANIYMINESLDDKSLFDKIFRVYMKKRYYKKLREHYIKNFEKLPQHLDYIFVIKGSTLKESEIHWLKTHYESAKFIIYQWDSVVNYPDAVALADFFDRCYTFDRTDAEKYGWKYRALFFDANDEYICKNEISYDLTYICSLHSRRAELYKKIKAMSESGKIRLFDYLYFGKWGLLRQKYIKRNLRYDIDLKSIKLKPLNRRAMDQIYKESKCLLDYKYDGQEGLTIRTIESIGYKCKLITNNKRIVDEDFYNANNIYVYDLDSFDIPADFLNTPYEDVPDSIYYKYSIRGWIDEIFELRNVMDSGGMIE